ncbi:MULTISPECIES: protein NO VEIN domain-containing protein [unclassified Streptomyces]|uniref:protein NO VEIN domain-containing protein n=1 Tax=Streptomyces sp. NPDC127532 TaxID=3345399 RepID=UPI003628DEE0
MSMPLPLTDSTRRAALRWLMLLRVSGVPRVQVVLTHDRRYADLTPAQYAAGLAWLRRTGMVTAEGRPVVEVSDSAMGDMGASHGVPLAKWSQAADEARRAVGEAGEHALLRLLEQGGLPHVRHVAAESDAYGYDIEAAWSGKEGGHLEVKSTTDPTRLVIHLTRHECDVMMTDQEWCLAAVLVGMDGEAVNVATVSRQWLRSSVPTDKAKEGKWESARLQVPASAISPGLTVRDRALLPQARLPSQPVWGS